MPTNKLPDLSRTIAAIETYDTHDATFDIKWDIDTQMAWMDESEKLGEAVGLAFGQDTADRNNVQDCRRMIRPGPRTPGPGCELSFVRRMVRAWLEHSQRSESD